MALGDGVLAGGSSGGVLAEGSSVGEGLADGSSVGEAEGVVGDGVGCGDAVGVGLPEGEPVGVAAGRCVVTATRRGAVVVMRGAASGGAIGAGVPAAGVATDAVSATGRSVGAGGVATCGVGRPWPSGTWVGARPLDWVVDPVAVDGVPPVPSQARKGNQAPATTNSATPARRGVIPRKVPLPGPVRRCLL